MFIKLQISIYLTSFFMDYLCQDITTEWEFDAEFNKSLTTIKPTKYSIYYRRFLMGEGICSKIPSSLNNCIPLDNYKEIVPMERNDSNRRMESNDTMHIKENMNTKKTIYESCGLTTEIFDECEPYQCVYNNMGTEENPGPYRQYITEYIDPNMTDVMNDAITTCTGVELSQQGLMKNCPAYDIHVCLRSEKIKNTPVSYWDPGCMQEREYYIRCYVCPLDCLIQSSIEPGTCNACTHIRKPRKRFFNG